MLLHSRPKLTDFYILSRTKLLENHTLHSGKYPHILYIEVPLAILIVILHLFNPLNPKIKIEILIYCPYTFSIEVVGRICWSVN